VLAYSVPYLLRTRHLAASGRPVPNWRQACFYAGLAVLVGADVPPLSTLSGELFAAHMVEHLLIGDVAALLIVIGLTGPVLAPVLRLPGLQWLRALAHPGVALPLWAVDLYAWHAPALYQGALRHPLVHGLEHACFFFFSVNLWMALLGPLPKPAWFGNLGRLGFIIAARMTGTVLANVFLWSGKVFYSYYGPGVRAHGTTLLSDQSLAGGIMMIEESILTIGLFCWLFLRTARQTEERDQLVELAAAQGIELEPARAARAVAAGRGEALRERLGVPEVAGYRGVADE
jgi:putative membrane protein